MGFYQDKTPSVKTTITTDSDHTLLSIITMLAPSPDRFTGLHDFELRPNGIWLESQTLEAFTYDAGTDSGSAYASRNKATEPPELITRIDGAPLDYQGKVHPTLRIDIMRIK